MFPSINLQNHFDLLHFLTTIKFHTEIIKKKKEGKKVEASFSVEKPRLNSYTLKYENKVLNGSYITRGPVSSRKRGR